MKEEKAKKSRTGKNSPWGIHKQGIEILKNAFKNNPRIEFVPKEKILTTKTPNKKILNVTKNEIADIEWERKVMFNPPKNIANVASLSEEITYKIKNKPSYWRDSDTYKIIDLDNL